VLGLGFDGVLTGRENILVNAATLGLSRKRTLEIMDDIIAFAEIEEFIDAPVQSYSSGMRARLGFAVAAHVNPDILLLDEILAVGDVRFRRKCRRHIRNFIDSGGTTLLVTHDMQAVQTICDRCLVLDHGRLLFDGHPTEGIHFYLQSRLADDDPEAVLARPSSRGAAPAATPIEVEVPTVTLESEKEEDKVQNNAALADESRQDEPTDEVPAPIDETPTPEEAINELPTAPEQPATTETSVAPTVEMLDAKPDPESSPPARILQDPLGEAIVVIDELAIRPVRGAYLKSHEPADFCLRFRSTETIEEVCWGFTIATEDGLVNIGSLLEGYRTSYCISPGEHELRLRLAKLPLHAGRYSLRAGLAERGTGAAISEIGWGDAPVLFSVRSDPSPENNIHAAIGDLVCFEHILIDSSTLLTS
jgi:ABC-type multidrug transport system ATPase subunit